MLIPVANLLAVILYLLAGALILRRLTAIDNLSVPTAKGTIVALAIGALATHGLVLFLTIGSEGGIDFGLNSASSMMGWLVAALFLLIAAFRPIMNVGVVIFPIAALTVFVAWVWPGHHLILPELSPFQLLHFVIAFVAYGLLTLAMVQALLLLWQERGLRHKHGGRLFREMPPLQTMEHLMFQLIGAGFVLLTLTLISGILFAEELFGRALIFTHHVVLSILAWLTFATLLAGRWRFGWRGRSAVHWTLGGFALLGLAYFGSKFMVEVVLSR